MNASPTIDRKRLERYPFDVYSGPLFVSREFLNVAILLCTIRASSLFAPLIEYAPPDFPNLWTIKIQFGHPVLGLYVGTAIAVVAGLVQRFNFSSAAYEEALNCYFLTDKERRLSRKNSKLHSTRLDILTWLFSMAAISASSFLLSASYVAIGFGFNAVVMLNTLPRNRALRTAIVWRRRVALAWEGVDPPNDRFTVGQKFGVGFSLALGCALIVLAELSINWTETEFSWSRMTDGLKAVTLHDRGGLLSVEEAAALERQLKESPSDYEARLKLIGFHWERYKEARKEEDVERAAAVMHSQLPHARYFIEHLPGHVFTEVARSAMPFSTDDPDYQEISDLWREQITKFPEDADVLRNAALFFEKPDEVVYEELLERGRMLEPDEPRWSEALDELARRQAEPKT